MRASHFLVLGLLLVAQAQTVGAQSDPAPQSFDRDEALAYSQAVIGREVSDHQSVDSEGSPFNLAQLRGRPLVISMIFTSCFHTCPLITKNLEKTVGIAREALGEDSFDVVTIGFDWAADTPQRMASYQADMGIDIDNWWFLSADESTITALSENIGFIFFPSARGFDHLAQTTVVGKDGKVFWQVYGATFEPPHLVEPLKRQVFDHRQTPLSLSAWIENVKFFCTIYDPASGRYRFDYSILIAFLTGIMSLGAIAVFVVKSWRQSV